MKARICFDANVTAFRMKNDVVLMLSSLYVKSTEGQSPAVSSPLKGQVPKDPTVKWGMGLRSFQKK